MVKVITVADLRTIIKKMGIERFFKTLAQFLEEDFSRWEDFIKSPRHAVHYPQGVFELMPICDDRYYTYKYVNGHPANPTHGKMTVVAIGMLAEIDSGYPKMICEMTLLTAFRTATINAIASKYLAKKNSKVLAIIGTGAQAEFLTLAHFFILGIDQVRFFDIDPQAMQKFNENLKDFPLTLIRCKDAYETLTGADIILTATADKQKARILENDWINEGVHINGIGGDCPGKTELDSEILKRSKIVVEFLEQTRTEGEIQNFHASKVYAELWEIIAGKKPGRVHDNEITLYDSTGFALEDYSVLRLVHKISEEYQIGKPLDLIPEVTDPKNLFGCLT